VPAAAPNDPDAPISEECAVAFSNEQHRRRYAEDAQYRARKLAANRDYRVAHRARLNLTWWERWRSDAELREKRRVRQMEKKYGLPPGTYQRMLAEQNGLCAICKRRRKLCIDHDHVTKQVRQLLCNKCNLAIGLFEDDADRSRAGGAYLDRWRGSGIRAALVLRAEAGRFRIGLG
jgi:Recombination endonuclease VII